MAAQVGTFVDDARLLPRDNSGGPMGPHGIKGSDWGDGGKPIGGEPAAGNVGAGDDEMVLRSGGNYKRSDKDQRVSKPGKGGY